MHVQQKHIYCDACSEVVYPNEPAILYLCDRLVAEEKAHERGIELTSPELGDFKLLRVSHRGCEPILPYPAQGYTELILETTWTREFTLTRPELLESSSRNSGLPYDPEAAFDSLTHAIPESPEFIDVLQDNPTPHGPHDLIIHYIVTGLDPRLIIDNKTGELVAHQHADELRAQFLDGAEEMLQKWRDEGPPNGFKFVRGDNSEERDERGDFEITETVSDDDL
jgi:hypothetical protein